MESSSNETSNRTEELQHIIERMPTKFGRIVTLIGFSIVILIFIFGWLIRYPDVIVGTINITTNHAPLKLVAPHSGNLLIANIKSQQNVQAGELIGWIENPASIDDITKIKTIINDFSPPINNAESIYKLFPKQVSLGELTTKYFTLLNTLKLLANYQGNKLFDKQINSLKNLLQEQKKVLQAEINQRKISKQKLDIVNRIGIRDSTLFDKKVISKSALNQTKLRKIEAKIQHQTNVKDVAYSREQISKTNGSIKELIIRKSEKQQQLNLNIIKALNSLKNNFLSWEKQYLIKAPFNGQIQFLKFWENNQFVQAGEPIFTVIPTPGEIIGQVILPAKGAGKIKKGQETIVKLKDYPYMEYGSVTGYVRDISLTTNTIQSQKGKIETYLVTIDFPNQLKTNYGTYLNFKYGIKGIAEIITKDRRLIERFLDNLKYVLHNK